MTTLKLKQTLQKTTPRVAPISTAENDVFRMTQTEGSYMTVIIRPNPLDRYITISVNGVLMNVENAHQGFEFEVYAEDGTFLSSGTSRNELDNALAGVRILNDRNSARDATQRNADIRHVANKIEELVAAKEERKLAVRVEQAGVEVADMPELYSEESYELEWRAHDDPDPSYGP